MEFNRIFCCNLLPNMKPNKSLKIFKLFLTKSQLPYEMVFVLEKCVKMVMTELAEYYGKETSQIDADTMIPYLNYVVIRGIHEANQEQLAKSKSPSDGETEAAQADPTDEEVYSQDHLMNTAFKSRLLMVEYFTIKELGFGESNYTFVTFKTIEKMLDEYQMD